MSISFPLVHVHFYCYCIYAHDSKTRSDKVKKLKEVKKAEFDVDHGKRSPLSPARGSMRFVNRFRRPLIITAESGWLTIPLLLVKIEGRSNGPRRRKKDRTMRSKG